MRNKYNLVQMERRKNIKRKGESNMKIKVARKNRENLKAKRYPNGMHAETKSACPFNESRIKEKHANGMQEETMVSIPTDCI